MPKGFFTLSKTSKQDPSDLRISKCGLCGLYKNCRSPKIKPTGNGERKILIVSDNPNNESDSDGLHLTGDYLWQLQTSLNQVGINLENDCWLTSAIICHRPHRDPTTNQTQTCRANLFNTIKELSPKVVILLGSHAIQSMVGYLWKESIDVLSRWIGQQIPCPELNTWLVPTWHPSFVCTESRSIIDLLFIKTLQQAVNLIDTPVPLLIDYKTKIIIELSADKAADTIKKFLNSSLVAFDYETNCLKPEFPGAKIICCAISDGNTTIAYPWHGAAIKATRQVLHSNVPKIAANMKFEERWSRIHAGGKVKNWKHCTMIGAHILDNRQSITSLKFQSYINFGVGCYDEHIKPYMNTGKNGLNKLDQLDIKELLLYNGMDALLTWKLEQLQAEKFICPLK